MTPRNKNIPFTTYLIIILALYHMSHTDDYDLVVLGSGRGRFLAWSMASEGKRTAVVERRYVTGSCPSIACLPSKYLIHGAKVASYFPQGCRVRDRPGRLEGRYVRCARR